MAEVTAFLIALARARLVETCMENPAGSYIYKFAPIHDATLGFYKAIVKRCAFEAVHRGLQYV